MTRPAPALPWEAAYHAGPGGAGGKGVTLARAFVTTGTITPG